MDTTIPIRNKAPGDVFFIQFDHSKWLNEIGSTVIASSVWEVTPEGGLTLTEEAFDDTTTTVKVAGGTLGESYLLTNRFTTANGQTKERSIWIWLRRE